MPSKYPVLKPDEVVQVLKEFGFVLKSQKGSHAKYAHQGKTVVVPMHGEIRKGTLKSILSQAGISLEELKELL